MTNFKRIDPVFPDSLIEQLSNYIDQVPWSYGWKSSKSKDFGHWNHDFTQAAVENGLDVSASLPEPISTAWNFLRTHYIGDQVLLRSYTNSHTYGVEGYPHTDSQRRPDCTMVIYMNREWQRDWHGETTIYDGNTIIHAELPKYNAGLVFPGAQTHCARSVSRICPAQRITLMFKFAPRNVDLQRDRIQLLLMSIGANKIKHSKGTLMGHLLRVYDRLRANGHDDQTCAAGGLHSIFGTNVFQTQMLKPNQRDLVVKTIGLEATELVELFSTIARPQTLVDAIKTASNSVKTTAGKTIELTPDRINRLCAIEAANLSDQGSLGKYESLKNCLKHQQG